MEQYNNYPILMKTKPVNLSSTSSMYSFDSPWEEVGLVWPPRFYSCSFCRREFRSAQALGGHMNVHRRDRAKLKQSNSTSDQEITNPAAFSNMIKTTSAATTYQETTRKLIDLVDSDDDGDGEVGMCKRYKKSTGVSPLMKILYCSSSSSREEIDLELRLGAVK